MDNEDLLLTSSQSSQQNLCLWNYLTKNLLKSYKHGGTVPPKCLTVVGKDYILACELGKPMIHAWPLNSQDLDKNIRLTSPKPATCLAVCPKNAYLAAGIDTKLNIWQLSSGKLLSVQRQHYQPITCIKFSSNAEYVAAGGEDGILTVYFLAHLATLHHNQVTQNDAGQVEPVYIKNDHTMPICDIHIGLFGSDSRLATCSSDRSVRIYTLSTGDLLLHLMFSDPLTTLALDAPCWNMYVGTSAGVVHHFDLREPPRTLSATVTKDRSKEFIGHTAKITAMALNLDNTILATGSEDRFVYTWEILSRQILQKIEQKAAVTNVLFVRNFENFFAETIKPEVVFNPLQRTVALDDTFTVSMMQTQDIEFSDDENCEEKELSRKRLEEENALLRIKNAQLFQLAVELTKKYNLQ